MSLDYSSVTPVFWIIKEKLQTVINFDSFFYFCVTINMMHSLGCFVHDMSRLGIKQHSINHLTWYVSHHSFLLIKKVGA